MIKFHIKHLLVVVAIFSCGVCLAEESEIDLDISGYTSFEFGQIMSGTYSDYIVRRKWQSRMFGGLTITADVEDRFRIFFSPGFMKGFSFFDPTKDPRGDFEIYKSYQEAFLDHMEGVFYLGDYDNSPLQLGVGYFPYKYNRNGRNFGEYLFLASAYPFVLFNDFDGPKKGLLGFRASSIVLDGMFRQNLFFTSEAEHTPTMDFSLAYLAGFNFSGILDIGAGINFDRYFPVDERETTPTGKLNIASIDSIAPNPDTTSLVPDPFIGDTTYYTHKAIKLVAHFSLDPKAPFDTDFFGKEDLKFYGEVAVLGLKDYGDSTHAPTAYYTDIKKRIPWMVGFNVPAFNLMDVLSLELEHYPSEFKNDHREPFITRMPWPIVDPNKAKWRWSVWAEKSFMDALVLKAVVAHDHIFTRTSIAYFQDTREALSNKGDWHYRIKTLFKF